MPLAEACDAACRIRVAECPFIAVCAMVYAIEYQTPFGRVKISSKELLQRSSVLRKSEKPSSGIADYHGLSYAKYDLRLTDRAFSALGAQKHKVAKERSELLRRIKRSFAGHLGKENSPNVPQIVPQI